jgi:diguanylate cyclase (GGDEF)-like protein
MLALFELARGLNNRMGLSDVGDVIVKHLRRIVPASLFVFYLYDVDADELVSSYAFGEHTDLVTGLRIPLGQRLTGWVGAHRQTIRNSDPVLDLGEGARSVTPRPRSCLSTPLAVGDSLTGVLSLYASGREAFSDDHQRIVEVIARQVTPVIQQALTLDRGRHSAFRDQVSGLPNHEQLEALARTQSVLTNGPTALIYIAVSGLNEINAQYGHEAADDALNHVVTCTRKHIRSSDFLFRYEDDQFLVLQFQTDSGLATAIAERIGRSVATESTRGLPHGVVRVALGVSVMPDDGQSVDALIKSAKRRLGHLAAQTAYDPNQPPESIH